MKAMWKLFKNWHYCPYSLTISISRAWQMGSKGRMQINVAKCPIRAAETMGVQSPHNWVSWHFCSLQFLSVAAEYVCMNADCVHRVPQAMNHPLGRERSEETSPPPRKPATALHKSALFCALGLLQSHCEPVPRESQLRESWSWLPSVLPSTLQKATGKDSSGIPAYQRRKDREQSLGHSIERGKE